MKPAAIATAITLIVGLTMSVAMASTPTEVPSSAGIGLIVLTVVLILGGVLFVLSLIADFDTGPSASERRRAARGTAAPSRRTGDSGSSTSGFSSDGGGGSCGGGGGGGGCD